MSENIHIHLSVVVLSVIFDLGISLFSQSCTFSQDGLVTEIILMENVELRMQELASVAVRTECSSVELGTNLGFEVLWNMSLSDQFVFPMSE